VIRHLICAIVLALVFAGCGGDDGPTMPRDTPTGVTITTSATMFYIGATVTLSASVTMSSGSTQPLTSGCAWGTDSADILNINPSTGAMTGTGSGEATVWCDYQGMRGTKRLRILPNYAGTFLGSYTVTGCSDSGDFRSEDFCDSFPNRLVLPLRFDFQQNNDSLNGRTSLGSVTSDAFVSTVRVDGGVQVLSRHANSGFTIQSTWDLTSRQAGRIEGRVATVWTFSGASGQGRVTGDLFNTNRQLTAARVLAPASPPVKTLRDLVNAIRR
jgi:hypothetical protein